MAKLHPDLDTAVKIAQEAEWPISFRNGKVIITAPDGIALTVGSRPNEETLKVWRATCRKYNLTGEGPAMTPAQQDELKAQAENPEKKSATPATAKKIAEAAAAARKAEDVVAQAAKLPAAPASPTKPVIVPVVSVSPVTPATIAEKAAAKAAPKPKVDKDGFPPFEPDMLLPPKDYSVFLLTSGKDQGRYFCPTCWERGEKFTAKRPQGIASHRGFKHALFISAADAPGGSEVTTLLPESVATALELLRNELVEALADTTDASLVQELETKVEELNKVLADRDQKIKNLVSDLEKQKVIAEERGNLLDGEKIRYDEEAKKLMDKINSDFVQCWINELAPVKAVGRIDDMIGKYLDN
jgi:hypothetical protein